MVVFSGTCVRCGVACTWDALTQRLSCLEAKNNDGFGDCARGVHVENHAFDQECDVCADEDEGIVGDIGEDVEGIEVEVERGSRKRDKGERDRDKGRDKGKGKDRDKGKGKGKDKGGSGEEGRRRKKTKT
jgi:Fe-S-cluster-containing hydrogenase component 2